MPYVLDTIEEERNFRLTALDQQGQGCRERFLASLADAWGGAPADHQVLIAAYEFAIAQDYNHAGLTAEAYLAHPLRVAEMVMSFAEPADRDTVIIAILHNVLEVGSTTEEELASRFGSTVSGPIATLTVDRSLQWDPHYKQDYYQRILAAYPSAPVVKVFDKFDNIFLLCLNPDEQVRTRYLDEIRTYVLPMAEQCVPNIVNLFSAAADNAVELGYLEH